MNIKQEYALKYAALGWKVFPLHYIREDGRCSCGSKKCVSPGKHPATLNGVKDATSDPDKLMALFKDDRLNIAVEAYPFFVYDIDPRNGGDDTWSQFIKDNDLPETVIQISGGGGLHFLFNVPAGKKLKRAGKGIDVKKKNGYIVVEPSNHHTGGEYYWDGAFSPIDGQAIAQAPEWMLEDEIQEKAESRPTKLLEYQIEEIKSALEFINPDDGYDPWLEIIQSLHSLCDPIALVLADEWSQRSTCYDYAELEYKWGTFKADKGYNIETVFYRARKNGWPGLFNNTEIEINLKSQPAPKYDTTIPEYLLTPPGILNDITKQIVSTARMPQPVYAVNAALSLVATLAARKVQNETGLRTNLYLVSLGPTGSGKEHARNYIKNALHALGKDSQLGGEDIASGQGLMARAAMSPDAVFQIDELGKFLCEATDKNSASHKVSVLTNLMKLFSSSTSVVTGTEYANQKMNERQLIEYPCINLHGTSTDSTFYDSLKGVHILDGFVNRIIVTQTDTPRPPKQRIAPASKPAQSIMDWFKKFENHISNGAGLLGIQPENPFVVKMTQAAWNLFDKLDQEIDRKMEESRGTGLDSLYVRVWEHAAKVALICGCAKDAPLVDEAEARWAIDFVMYWNDRLVSEAQYRIADSEFGHTMNLVLRQVQKAGEKGITHGRVFNHRKLRETQPNIRQQIISALADNGEIQVIQSKPKGAGRPSISYLAAKYANC